jgi:hypothetical protein
LVPHRSLTLPFEPFRFWLRIRGDIRKRKTTPRLGDSPTRRVGESAFECLKENSASGSVGDFPTRRVRVSSPTLWCQPLAGSPAVSCLKNVLNFLMYRRLYLCKNYFLSSVSFLLGYCHLYNVLSTIITFTYNNRIVIVIYIHYLFTFAGQCRQKAVSRC